MFTAKEADKTVWIYQQSKNSAPLLKAFEPFLDKYVQLFHKQTINFRNYDIRYFLSCYLKDENDRRTLRRGKYHSQKVRRLAYDVLNYISQAFISLSQHDIKAELIIPFLEVAKRYKDQNKSFSAYLYRAYKYELKRHIDRLLEQNKNYIQLKKLIVFDDSPQVKKDLSDLNLDDDLILSHPDWISGKKASPPFKDFSAVERKILAKYYLEGHHTDRDIGRIIGRNPKSVQRIRTRLKRKLEHQILKGDIKWIRLLA